MYQDTQLAFIFVPPARWIFIRNGSLLCIPYYLFVHNTQYLGGIRTNLKDDYSICHKYKWLVLGFECHVISNSKYIAVAD